MAKKPPSPQCDVVVAMVQSLISRNEEAWVLGQRMGLAIYDEVHHMQAAQFRHALPICPGFRLGLSATVEQKGMERLFLNHLGPVVYHSEETDLEPEIIYVHCRAQLTTDQWAKISRAKYLTHDMAEFTLTRNEVADSPSYNQAILGQIQDCAKEGRVQWVVSDRTDQLVWLHDHLPESSLLIGDTPDDQRGESVYKNPIVCAAVRLGTEGLNRRDLDTLHLCLPWSSKTLFVQSIGRILRQYPDKKTPQVYAYCPEDVPLLRSTFSGFKHKVAHYGYERREVWI